jgi:hypothetical protein
VFHGFNISETYIHRLFIYQARRTPAELDDSIKLWDASPAASVDYSRLTFMPGLRVFGLAWR